MTGEVWVKWGGKDWCPIEPATGMVELKLRDGSVLVERARAWHWHHNGSASDIVAFRLAVSADVKYKPAEINQDALRLQYRKKPVVIEAFKWTGGPDQTEDPVWICEALSKGNARFENIGTPEVALMIDTLEGTHRASRGDWIIRGIKGEIYPCKPDIFEATYESASIPQAGEPRNCTCHPSEASVPCQHKYAHSECAKADHCEICDEPGNCRYCTLSSEPGPQATIDDWRTYSRQLLSTVPAAVGVDAADVCRHGKDKERCDPDFCLCPQATRSTFTTPKGGREASNAALVHALKCARIKLSRYKEYHPETYIGGVLVEYEAIIKTIDAALSAAARPSPDATKSAVLWAVERWESEVRNRPLINIHRRTLDDTWRQVIRHFGGDPESLIGPAHDDLIEIRDRKAP